MEKLKFIAAVAEELGEDQSEITNETILADLEGWDSMGVLGIIALIDSQFNMVVEGDALGNCTTVGDIFDLLKSM